MDGTDADGEWSDEELLRSGSQTGVSDDQDNALLSGQEKKRRKKTSVSSREPGLGVAPASEADIQLHHHHHHQHNSNISNSSSKSNNHRPSLGTIIKTISSNTAVSDNNTTSRNWNLYDRQTAPSAQTDTAVLASGMTSSSGTHRMMTSAPDPVSAILDKIDAQIDAMDASDMSVVPKLTDGERKNSRFPKSSSSRSKSLHSGACVSGLTASADTGVGSLHDSELSDLEKTRPGDAIAGSAEVYSEANLTDGLTDDERARRLDSDIPSDLDSVAAQQIDIKFKEIMRKKKVPPDLSLPPSSPRKSQSSSRGATAAASQLASKLRSRSASRPSATMLSTGYGTDNESVRTEEFESKFMTLLVGGGQGGVSDSDGGKSKPAAGADLTRRRPQSVPPDTSKVTLSLSQPEVPGLAKEDEELLQQLVRVANETRVTQSQASGGPGSISRPRSVSPTRLSLQRYRTAENLRLGWENSGGPATLHRRPSQLFSWDDDFWKASTRHSPQSIASSASTFEEVESLCLSKSSSDSVSSSLRQWDRLNGGAAWGGVGGYWGPDRRQMWGSGAGGSFSHGRYAAPGSSSSRRQRISRQSSTTSTSTSRSSAGPGGSTARGDEDAGETNSHDSHAAGDGHGGKGTEAESDISKLLDSMRFLGSHDELDLADKLYLEKIFHRVIGKGNGSPSKNLKSVVKNPQRQEPKSFLTNNEVLLEKLHRLKRNQLVQWGSGSAPASATSSPKTSVPVNNSERRRGRDLILPDTEDPSPAVKPQRVSPSERYNRRRSNISNPFSISGLDSKSSRDSKYSVISSMSSLSMDNGSLRASPSDSTSPVPPASQQTHQHPNLATFLPVNHTLQRLSSVDSTTTGADAAFSAFSQPFTPSHAERVLMGLGFGAAEGFLPERFLKDWYNKISRAQTESSSGGGSVASNAFPSMTGSIDLQGETPGERLQQNKTILTSQPGKLNYGHSGFTHDRVSFQKPAGLERRDSHISSVSSVLDEAATYLPKENGSSSKDERLADYIVAHSPSSHQMLPPGGISSRAIKMRQFASSRQKSLPLHLETLTEEDELRIRKSGVDPFDKEARLQMFISDTMSNSGKSTNSEQSRCGSNQSETDSLSSCSEKLGPKPRPATPEWQQTSAYRKQEDQIPPQLQQAKRRSPRRSSDKHKSKKIKRTESSKQYKSKDMEKETHDNHNSEHTYKETVEEKQVKTDKENLHAKTNSKHSLKRRPILTKEENCEAKKYPNETARGVPKIGLESTTVDSKEEQGASKNAFDTNNQLPYANHSRKFHPLQTAASIHSGDSLEVADIMQNQLYAAANSLIFENYHSRHGNSFQHTGQGEHEETSMNNSIEPAMVSIVLEDVDQDSDSNRNGQDFNMMPQENNHLNIPLSRCSSSSLSPIPQSPVTVIEVGQLDNQQDSLDTEGTASSRDTDDDMCSSENSCKSRHGSSSKQRNKHKDSSPGRQKPQRRRGSDQTGESQHRLSVSNDPSSPRRLSLDVPTIARLRRISEQRLQEINEKLLKDDDDEESSPPGDVSKRRNSTRRASFSEESPIIINDYLANQNKSRTPSPHRQKSLNSVQERGSAQEGLNKRRRSISPYSGLSKEKSQPRAPSPSRSPSRASAQTSIDSNSKEKSQKSHKTRHHSGHYCCCSDSLDSLDREKYKRHSCQLHMESYEKDAECKSPIGQRCFDKIECCCCPIKRHSKSCCHTFHQQERLGCHCYYQEYQNREGKHHEFLNDSPHNSFKRPHHFCHHCEQHSRHQDYGCECHNENFNSIKVQQLKNENDHLDINKIQQSSASKKTHSTEHNKRDQLDETTQPLNYEIQEEQKPYNLSLQNKLAGYPYDYDLKKSHFRSFPFPTSAESSPASNRSAFTSTGKTLIKGSPSLLGGGSGYQSETDIDEFPTSVKLTLNQRPIGTFTKNMETESDTLRRTSNSSSVASFTQSSFNPNLLFSSSPKRYTDDFENGRVKERRAIHSISRAVQVSDRALNMSQSQIPGYLCRAHALSYPETHFFLAKDQAAQCNIIEATHFRDQQTDFNTETQNPAHPNVTGQNVHHIDLFSKFTQTGTTCYEVSSQTDWVNDNKILVPVPTTENSCEYTDTLTLEMNGNVHLTKQPQTNDSNFIDEDEEEFKEPSIDNYLYHPNNEAVHYKHQNTLKYNVIDETIELIDAELLHLKNKRLRDHSTNAQKRLAYKEFQGQGRVLSSVNKVRRVSEPETCNHTKTDKPFSERFAPSTWTDATQLSPRRFGGASKLSTKHCKNQQHETESLVKAISVRSSDKENHLKSLNNRSTESGEGDFHNRQQNLGKRYSVSQAEVYENGQFNKTGRLQFDMHPRLSNFTEVNTTDNILQPQVSYGELSMSNEALASPKIKTTNPNFLAQNIYTSHNPNLSPTKPYPTVDSKDLIVKMYEIQKDLTSYLKPCEGMYRNQNLNLEHALNTKEEFATEDLKEEKGNEAKQISNTFPYDFSIENANTSSSGYGALLCGTKAHRRFSTPAVCDGAQLAKKHSKLSRLKYQNNSHQNSFNSLDIELDFMNAGEPLGLPKSHEQIIKQDQMDGESLTYRHHQPNPQGCKDITVLQPQFSPVKLQNPMNEEYSVNNIDTSKETKDSNNLESYYSTSRAWKQLHSPKVSCFPKIVASFDGEQSFDNSVDSQAALTKCVASSMVSDNRSFLSPRDSVSSLTPSYNGSTPEIVISPLRSIHSDFLQVPHSPQHLLMKAKFPSLCSSPSGSLSPNRLTIPHMEDTVIKTSPHWAKSMSSASSSNTTAILKHKSLEQENITFKQHTKDSIPDSSTLGSVTELSNVSSLDIQSAGELSDTSMYPQFSEDSAFSLDIPGQQRNLDDFSYDDIGGIKNAQGKMPFISSPDALKLRRSLAFLGRSHSADSALIPQRDTFNGNRLKYVDEGEAASEDNNPNDDDSNASLAGSDNDKEDVDDMEILVHLSRITRQHSGSTYSEPDLDLIDGLSDDSLASSISDTDNMDTDTNFLTVSEHPMFYNDDLLQVSDYGGEYSPSSSFKNRSDGLSPVTNASPSTNENEDVQIKEHDPIKVDKSKPWKRYEIRKAFSEDWMSHIYVEQSGNQEDLPTVTTFFNENEESTGYGPEENKHFLNHQRRRGSKDNWNVVQAILDTQNETDQVQCTTETDGKEQKENTGAKARENEPSGIGDYSKSQIQDTDTLLGADHRHDDSSGDECDREITHINRNCGLSVKRIVKTMSDPVDKNVYSRPKEKEINTTNNDTVLQVLNKNDQPRDIYVERNTDNDNKQESEGLVVKNEEKTSGGEDVKPTSKTPADFAIQKSKTVQTEEEVCSTTHTLETTSYETSDTSGMLEVFQNADLSFLKNVADLKEEDDQKHQHVWATNAGSSDYSVSKGLANKRPGVKKTKGTFIPRVLSIEFFSDEEERDQGLNASEREFSAALPLDDLDSSLTADLEMVLSKSKDEFDELTNSLLVKQPESSEGATNLHTPLSQITEEDTQSDCSVSEASSSQRRKVWQVRNRFIYGDTQEVDSKQEFPVEISETESLGKKNKVDNVTPSSVSENGSVTDKTHPENYCDYGTEHDAHVAHHNTAAREDSSSTSEIKAGDSKGSRHFLSSLQSTFSASDDTFVCLEDVRGDSEYKENEASYSNITNRTAQNFVYTTSDPVADSPALIPVPVPVTRHLSPRSGIFKFAQALIEDAMDKAQAEHSATSEATSPSSCSSKSSKSSSKPGGQILDTEKHEKIIHLTGDVTTTFSTTCVTTRSNLNTAETNCTQTAHPQAEEKHVSTKTIQIGDYRHNKTTLAKDSHSIIPNRKSNGRESGSNGENKEIGLKTSGLDDDLVSGASVNKTNSSTPRLKELEHKMNSSKDSTCSGSLQNSVNMQEDISVRLEKSTNDTKNNKRTNETSNRSDSQLRREPSSDGDTSAFNDLKSRVKAMLLIDHGKDPGSSDSSSVKDENVFDSKPYPPKGLLASLRSESSNETSFPLRRVKVTTMFSQNSEDGGMIFMSSSIPDSGSEAEKSPMSDFEDGTGAASSHRPDLQKHADKKSPFSTIKTQLPQRPSMVLRGRKQLRTIRSRESLLKLHQQTHVSSSAGSDSDSDLSSALKSQKQLKGRTRVLEAAQVSSASDKENEKSSSVDSTYDKSDKHGERDKHKKENQFLKVEPRERRSRRRLGSPEPNTSCPSPDEDCSFETLPQGDSPASSPRKMSSSSCGSFSASASNPPTPKVIVQQPSEDNPALAQSPGRIFLFPTINPVQSGRTEPDSVDSNDIHLHSDTPTPLDKLSPKFNPKSRPRSGLTRLPGALSLRAHKPQFLSPNRAARPPRHVSHAPVQSPVYTREDDPSHPELAYLDIVPRFNSVSRNVTAARRATTVPGTSIRVFSPTNIEPELSGSSQNQAASETNQPNGSIPEDGDSSESQASKKTKYVTSNDVKTNTDLFQTSSTDLERSNEHVGLLILSTSQLDALTPTPGQEAAPASRVKVTGDSALSDIEPPAPDSQGDSLSLWHLKSLSVASRDSGFDSQSQGSPTPGAGSQPGKVNPSSSRQIGIVKEESES